MKEMNFPPSPEPQSAFPEQNSSHERLLSWPRAWAIISTWILRNCSSCLEAERNFTLGCQKSIKDLPWVQWWGGFSPGDFHKELKIH